MDRVREGEGAGEINVRREEVHETLSAMAPGRCTGNRWTRGKGPAQGSPLRKPNLYRGRTVGRPWRIPESPRPSERSSRYRGNTAAPGP